MQYDPPSVTARRDTTRCLFCVSNKVHTARKLFYSVDTLNPKDSTQKGASEVREGVRRRGEGVLTPGGSLERNQLLFLRAEERGEGEGVPFTRKTTGTLRSCFRETHFPLCLPFETMVNSCLTASKTLTPVSSRHPDCLSCHCLVCERLKQVCSDCVIFLIGTTSTDKLRMSSLQFQRARLVL